MKEPCSESSDYRKFIEVTLQNFKIAEIKGSSCVILSNEKPSAHLKVKSFFICCDGKQNDRRITPSTFLDVWHDTAAEVGLLPKVSIANDFMYAGNLTSCRKKDAYVSGLIRSILEFQPDVLFVDTNYLPSASTLNDRDLALIKQQTSVPIFGHSGDLLDEKGLDSARVWLSAVDVLFHSNVSLADHGLEGLEYLPYTCSRARYFAAERKEVPLFFSGIGNISRFWYLLSAKRFAAFST